ncbi:hypothetical protein glysoja_034809, partial [Glycine soja]
FMTIIVVVDRFSKGVHFGALPTQFTAFIVATLFMDTICKLHGFPRSIISDQVMNQTLEQYLHSFVHHQPVSWFKFLALAEWSYNTSQHASTGLTPYEVIYGKAPPTFSSYLRGSSRNDVVDSVLGTREEVHALLKRKLLKAQENMKFFADQ